MKKKLENISMLDTDDLIIMTLLYEKCSYVNISKALKLTPPAISHRLNKYAMIFGDDFFIRKKNNNKILSPTGLDFAKKAKKIVCLFIDKDENDFNVSNVYFPSV